MLDALDFFLMGLQDTLDGQVFDIELPLVGKQLQGAVDFIEEMRRDSRLRCASTSSRRQIGAKT